MNESNLPIKSHDWSYEDPHKALDLAWESTLPSCHRAHQCHCCCRVECVDHLPPQHSLGWLQHGNSSRSAPNRINLKWFDPISGSHLSLWRPKLLLRERERRRWNWFYSHHSTNPIQFIEVTQRIVKFKVTRWNLPGHEREATVEFNFGKYPSGIGVRQLSKGRTRGRPLLNRSKL